MFDLADFVERLAHVARQSHLLASQLRQLHSDPSLAGLQNSDAVYNMIRLWCVNCKVYEEGLDNVRRVIEFAQTLPPVRGLPRLPGDN